MAKKKTPDGILINTKYVPKEIMAILWKKQGEIKGNCGCRVSYQTAIYNMLKFVKDKNISQ